MGEPARDEYLLAFRGSFTAALRWHQFDALWDRLIEDAANGWYLYAIGEMAPEEPAASEAVKHFLLEIARLLREEHAEDYCGIVYADDLANPSFVKIYDPNNLGVSCGYSNNPPLPGWVMSKIKPVSLDGLRVRGKNRQRWWQKIWGN